MFQETGPKINLSKTETIIWNHNEGRVGHLPSIQHKTEKIRIWNLQILRILNTSVYESILTNLVQEEKNLNKE